MIERQLFHEHFPQTTRTNGNLVSITSSETIWYPWTGSSALRTLPAICELAGLKPEAQGRPTLELRFKRNVQDVRTRLKQIVTKPPTTIEIAGKLFPKSVRKYDDYLTEELRNAALTKGVVDLDSAPQVMTLATSDNSNGGLGSPPRRTTGPSYFLRSSTLSPLGPFCPLSPFEDVSRHRIIYR